MQLPILDIAIVVGYVIFSLFLGLYFSRRGTKSIDDYFVSGRALPWWLAGTSMIASAYAIDTPLGITGLVAQYGIQGVWFAWSFILSGAGVLGAFIFASMFRRSRIITIAELVELRYSGAEAATLRVFKGIYFGIIANALTMGWVIKAVATFGQAALGWDLLPTLTIVLTITLIYTTMAGMWGIAATDFIQFIFSTVGSFALAYYAWRYIGGTEGIITGFFERYGALEAAERLHFIPRIDSSFFHIFIVFVALKWWGNPPTAIAQRMVSSKDAKHASLATLLFSTVHFCINYWPMILVALVSIVVYPHLSVAQAEAGYAKLIVELLPTGVLGIMLAALIAAFMSTIDTHINMGASYMVKDIYQRFLVKDASKKHYVRVSQLCTILMLAIAIIIAYYLESVQKAWYYLAMLTSGYGFVLIIRWFWWRINAWSEISALISSGIGTLVAYNLMDFETFGTRFTFVMIVCTVTWVIVTLLTKPSDPERLAEFCRLVKPFPRFWGPIRDAHPEIKWDPHFLRRIIHFVLGAICLFGICFTIGHVLFANFLYATILFGIAIASGLSIALTWREIEAQ